tara:strand:- start:568 stop:960 length:393 start_codon:yes stop_codon:yes gene_type:complete
MELILTNETFNINNIMIKYSKINQKIIYQIDNIYLLGIPLKLNNYNLLSENEKMLILKLKDKNTISILKKINNFFTEKYKTKYKPFINKDNIIKLRKNEIKKYKDTENIYISINNIKKRSSFITIHIFAI